MTTAQWRGRLDDDAGDDAGKDPEAVDSANGAAKARALLGSLLRPRRYTVAFLAVVVVVENAARLSVPLLVQRGIDRAIPPLLAGDAPGELAVVVGHCAPW